jgi:hypothetical protein
MLEEGGYDLPEWGRDEGYEEVVEMIHTNNEEG